MKLTQLALIVTEDCNLSCSYCFQEKSGKQLEKPYIKKAAEFFFPFLDADSSYIVFYGGEPLLEFDRIKYAVSLFEELNKEKEKNITYSVTTNGSLVTDSMLEFFDRFRFNVMLSFDGPAQEHSRRHSGKAGLEEMTALVGRFRLYKDISFSVNSVFSPETVSYLSESMQYIVSPGLEQATYQLSIIERWEQKHLDTLAAQLKDLKTFLAGHYEKTGRIPISNFRPPSAPGTSKTPLAGCGAAANRMAISPGGNLWGCYVFHDYLKNKTGDRDFATYSIGHIDSFIHNHEALMPGILENHSALRQDFYFTGPPCKENISQAGNDNPSHETKALGKSEGSRHCFLCENLADCSPCPVNAAYATSMIGKLPTWLCAVNGVRKLETHPPLHGETSAPAALQGPKGSAGKDAP
ncbi:MAG: 4Fe-4S cluster-binding domain-containing protein [bacterium]|nr:4Fe-4S cluster-binding domain-containing protein [bacterium]